jgi:hypothetical protein
LIHADKRRRARLLRFPCDQAGLMGFGHQWKSIRPL